MIRRLARLFRQRIVFAILAPVLFVGVVISIVATKLITPPILDAMRERIDAELLHVSKVSQQICETQLNYMLDLRLEDDAEMNLALQRMAAMEINGVEGEFADLHVVIVDGEGKLVAASEAGMWTDLALDMDSVTHGEVQDLELMERPVRACGRFFPFWDWHVIGYVHDASYRAPLELAEKVIYAGSFGVLLAVWLVLLVVASVFIRGPLHRLGEAARGVAEGELTHLTKVRDDEIGRVADTFNAMVDSLRTKDSEVTGLIGALRESEQRYRDLFAGATEGILVAGAEDRRFRYANPAVCRALQYNADELKSMIMTDIHPPEAIAGLAAEFQAIAAGGERGTLVDAPCLRKDGGIIYMDIKATAVEIDGEACVLGFLTDTTARRAATVEREQLERRLHNSEKMEAIGLLAGGVAHDLNNILGGLSSYPELLLMDLPEDSPLRGPLETIEESGWRAAAIVQDLLTLARRGVAVSEVTNLNDAVTSYLDSPEHEKLCAQYPAAGIEADLAGDLPNVKGSPVHLTKTVMNLVSNAVEAVRERGGRVRIATRNEYVSLPIAGYDEVQEGDYAVLTVEDDGVGIEESDLKRIFEPFYSRKVMGSSGTGLGMAVVWGTVKDHDGYIDVESRVRQGTRFSLYFPITRVAADIDSSECTIDRIGGAGETILVVDDIAEQRELATRMLKRLGYRVESVSSGEAAVERLRTESVDLLVLDMIMDPGMDGLDTYTEVLSFRPGQRAVIASGYSESDRVREALRRGAHGYVKKPYTLEAIGLAVRDALDAEAPAH